MPRTFTKQCGLSEFNSLLLVAMPLLLVASLLLIVRPGAPSSVLAPSSDAPVTSRDHFPLWSVPRPIFMQSDDIRSQLPEDSKRFEMLDNSWKDMVSC